MRGSTLKDWEEVTKALKPDRTKMIQAHNLQKQLVHIQHVESAVCSIQAGTDETLSTQEKRAVVVERAMGKMKGEVDAGVADK